MRNRNKELNPASPYYIVDTEKDQEEIKKMNRSLELLKLLVYGGSAAVIYVSIVMR